MSEPEKERRAEELREGTRLSERAAGVIAAAEVHADEERDLSKDELYEMAKDAGISGRSSMTKAELAAALRRVGRI